MSTNRSWDSSSWLASLVIIILGFSPACVSSAVSPSQSPAKTIGPTTAIAVTVTPTPESPPPENRSAAAGLQPYPYTTPLPPPTPTILDGIYRRVAPDRGTPVPCIRCAPYKAEGGDWTLTLTAGAFRVSHEITDFQGVGSFTVTGDRITFFNDPNCHQDVGVYQWHLDGRSLVLEEVDDPCAFGLRSNNLTTGRWAATEQQGRQINPCLPPNLEVAVTGHWPEPSECKPGEVTTK